MVIDIPISRPVSDINKFSKYIDDNCLFDKRDYYGCIAIENDLLEIASYITNIDPNILKEVIGYTISGIQPIPNTTIPVMVVTVTI